MAGEIDREIVKILKLLEGFIAETEYEQYKKYRQVREIVGNRVNLPLIPICEDYCETIEKANYILDCIIFEDKINHFLIDYHIRQKSFYEYRDEQFQILMLKSLNEFFKESERQHSCLWSYVSSASMGDVTILALRKKEKPGEPYVTIEIQGSKEGKVLKQVKGRYNREVDDSVKEWIIDYCDQRDIETSECDDLFDSFYDDEIVRCLYEPTDIAF